MKLSVIILLCALILVSIPEESTGLVMKKKLFKKKIIIIGSVARNSFLFHLLEPLLVVCYILHLLSYSIKLVVVVFVHFFLLLCSLYSKPVSPFPSILYLLLSSRDSHLLLTSCLPPTAASPMNPITINMIFFNAFFQNIRL